MLQGKPSTWVVLLIAAICFASAKSAEQESQHSASCESSSATGSCDASPRRDDLAWPLRMGKGENRTITVSDDGTGSERTLIVEKLSSSPPIFRIKQFLTPDECQTLRKLAVQQGLKPGVVDSDDGLSSIRNEKKKMGIFDMNGDGRLSLYELIRMIDDYFESHVSEEDVRSMLSSINLVLDVEQNLTISIQEFIHSNTAAMRHYFSSLIQANPSKRSRFSSMAWLVENTISNYANGEGLRVVESIRRRLSTLTKLPDYVVHGDMEMQVVHYKPPRDDGSSGGHYTAHFDSLSSEQQPQSCCHISHRQPPCRPCRMATVLYSLSDSLGGGDTAFPLALDNDPQHQQQHTAETVEEWRLSSASRESSYCASDGPGLRVPPELGQAILWYNHDIQHYMMTDEFQGIPPLLGRLDRSTIHAGCPVVFDFRQAISNADASSDHASLPWNAPGKWIANHWIEASNVAGEDEAHYEKLTAARRVSFPP